jgi:predicted outer membrane protein
MRISRLMLNTTLALSLPLLAQGQQPGAPAIPRTEPAAAPTGQPATLPAPAQNQPGQPRVQQQPGQLQPAQTLQSQPNRTTVTANKPVVGDQANQTASQQVATLLAICNHKEVKLAELAKNKSENKDVREFADMMIKDHSECLGKLSQFGGQAGLGTTSATEPTNRTSDANRTTTSAGNAANSGGLDFVAVQRQAAQQCLTKAQKKWSEHKSAECDMAYIGSQIVAHEEMINHAQALRPYATPELQAEIDKGITAAEHHRDEAHKLIKKLGEEQQKKS